MKKMRVKDINDNEFVVDKNCRVNEKGFISEIWSQKITGDVKIYKVTKEVLNKVKDFLSEK